MIKTLSNIGKKYKKGVKVFFSAKKGGKDIYRKFHPLTRPIRNPVTFDRSQEHRKGREDFFSKKNLVTEEIFSKKRGRRFVFQKNRVWVA